MRLQPARRCPTCELIAARFLAMNKITVNEDDNRVAPKPENKNLIFGLVFGLLRL
jgi:hypothetical protein